MAFTVAKIDGVKHPRLATTSILFCSVLLALVYKDSRYNGLVLYNIFTKVNHKGKHVCVHILHVKMCYASGTPVEYSGLGYYHYVCVTLSGKCWQSVSGFIQFYS